MKKIMKKFESPAELISTCLILIIAVYFFIGTFQFSGGDEFFPRLTSGATIICTIAYIAKSLLGKSQSKQHEAQEKEAQKKEAPKENSANRKSVIVTVALFIAYVVMVWLFGFIIATIVFTVAYPLALGYRKPLSIVILLMVNFGFVLLFQQLMGISLSKGTLLDLTAIFF